MLAALDRRKVVEEKAGERKSSEARLTEEVGGLYTHLLLMALHSLSLLLFGSLKQLEKVWRPEYVSVCVYVHVCVVRVHACQI